MWISEFVDKKTADNEVHLNNLTKLPHGLLKFSCAKRAYKQICFIVLVMGFVGYFASSIIFD